MNYDNHDWIANYSDFEFVLVCQNDLPDWDRDGITRAFQTYQWNDGSTPGNDCSYVHESTGVVVRHEGALLAVEFGHGELHDALPDLFEVLHALGWRKTDVYHPTETIDALLTDIGRAIPARLDFDAQPAPGPRAISGFAEGTSLLELGKSIMAPNEVDLAQQTVLQELRSMDDEHICAPVARLTQPIALVDEDCNISEPDELVVVLPAAVAAVPTQAIEPAESPKVDYADEPGVFVLPVTQTVFSAQASVSAATEEQVSVSVASPEARHASHEDGPAPRAPQTVSTAPAASGGQDATRSATQVAAPPPIRPAVLVAHPAAATSANVALSNPSSMISSRALLQMDAPPKIVKVGSSLFCFDLPCDGFSDQEFLDTANEYGFSTKQIVSLHPGSLKEPIRWDVLGEIASEYPGFAEKLADLMDFGGDDRTMISAIFLGVKKASENAQLRDALMFAGLPAQQMSECLAMVSPAAELMIAHSDEGAVAEWLMAAMTKRLGALALTPTGASFVDLRDTFDNTPAEFQEKFTLREIIQSSTPRMFVVHVDAMDGPFVGWIVDLLRAVALLQTQSRRNVPVVADIVPIADEVRVEFESKMRAIDEAKQVVSGMMDQLDDVLRKVAAVSDSMNV